MKGHWRVIECFWTLVNCMCAQKKLDIFTQIPSFTTLHRRSSVRNPSVHPSNLAALRVKLADISKTAKIAVSVTFDPAIFIFGALKIHAYRGILLFLCFFSKSAEIRAKFAEKCIFQIFFPDFPWKNERQICSMYHQWALLASFRQRTSCKNTIQRSFVLRLAQTNHSHLLHRIFHSF